MIYLSGVVRPELLGKKDLGVMLTPHIGNRPDLSETHWAADTGCFLQPDKFKTESYLDWLRSRENFFDTCLFATAPDRVGDAQLTLDLSEPVLPRIRELGIRASLVAQHGLEDLDIPWDSFDCLFIGGWDRWKRRDAPFQLIREAKSRGKYTHLGRVNSWIKLHRATEVGCDSVDGTFLATAPDFNLKRLNVWLDKIHREPSLIGAN